MLHHLELALDEASASWTAPKAKLLVGQVEQLGECLDSHFSREEEGGFLDDAMAVAPRFGTEADRLLDEHAQLLTCIRELIRVGRENIESNHADWQSFAALVRSTIRRLLSHEARENNLLQRAFNVTNGT
jgi:hypothetical protein